MVIEISFPRGGKKPSKQKSTSKVKYDLFNNKKKPKKKKIDLRNEMGPTNFVEKTVCPEEITQTCVDLLSYQSIKEGMVLMGCIREVQKMNLTILLPGRLSGKVMITQISGPYTKLLQSIANNQVPAEYREVKQIFHSGQYVAVKVLNFQGDDAKSHLNLSMCPHDTNSNLSFKCMVTGMSVWGAVSCCEDHGYVIDLGVKNCRAFLPKANADKEYACGELLWCVIQNCQVTGAASTVTVNSLKEKMNTMKIIKDLSLDYMLPGMQVDVTITKILNNGLQVKFLDDYTGYVHESYLQNNFDKLSSYNVDQVISGRVLYITPITKLTLFTLRSLDAADETRIEDGSILSGTVLGTTKGGLYLKLKKTLKGFVSYKRLKLKLNNDLDYNDQIKKNYFVGSQHQCRVLSYDCMENIYICTMEKDFLKQEIFTYGDLKVGQDLTVEIREIQTNGLLIQAGRLKGYILNEHLTDSILSNYANIKSKYHVGQKIKGKIWTVNEENSTFHLTLKPSFLNSKQILTSYECAEHNKQYPGMIIQITKNGLLVKFFGNVRGWIPQNQLSFERVSRPDMMFKIGQIVNCTVIKTDVDKLTLSLQPPKAQSQRKQLHFGQRVNVQVTQVLATGLEVKTLDTKISAIVPSQHLTHTPLLAEIITKTYNQDDILNDLVCINAGHGVPILSLRDREIDKIPEFNDIREGQILRCSINSINDKRLLLQSPVNGFGKLIVVSSENVCDVAKKITQLDLKKNQSLITKIIKVNHKDQIVHGTSKLSEVWDGDLNDAKQLLIQHLLDTRRIHDHFTKENNPLIRYKLGESVVGVIKKINRSGTSIVSISDGEIQGIIDSKHSIPNLKVGQQITGTVFNINYVKNSLELTINPIFINKINHKQTGIINIKPGKVAIADVLLVKKECVIVTLRGHGNRQIAYLPTRLHINDTLLNASNYQVGDEIKTEILHAENEFVIAMSKELIKNFEKAKKLMKRARINSESSDDGSAKKTKTQIVSENSQKNLLKNSKKKEKRKRDSISDENEKTVVEKKSKICSDNDESNKDVDDSQNNETNKSTSCESESESENELSQQNVNTNETKTEPVLSGVSHFWETPTQERPEEESSEDEEEIIEDLTKKQKKKKLTPAERAELARQEEEKLRKIETELADAEADPKTADQFDRLVLADPNNSMMWIKYIAFHLEATEIEKARAIARKALNAIEFREEQEKFNVWIALLNLENRYGTKDSFSNILEEALKMNDSLAVHLQALNILSESNKTTEFLELLTTITRRYKQEPKMWTAAAEACYKCDQKEQARNLMQRAMKSLEEKQHINVIVQFAFLEAKWGEPERSEAILEKVLASYPKRVDVWCSYVDMLIKGNRIHIAKNVLERAVSQKLPPRKMKTLFTKFIQFETKYGDDDGVKRVRQMAEDYVKNALN